MDFSERLKEFNITVPEIEAIGYSRRTAYAWLKGTRKPPEQIQDLIITMIKNDRKGNE